MAYDEDLAWRIRAQLAGTPDVTEKAMFGGLAFLIGGHMAVAAIDRGGLMVRADPDGADGLLGAGVARVEMRGRPMRGWLEVDAEHLGTDEGLARWIGVGAAVVESLPPKTSPARR